MDDKYYEMPPPPLEDYDDEVPPLPPPPDYDVPPLQSHEFSLQMRLPPPDYDENIDEGAIRLSMGGRVSHLPFPPLNEQLSEPLGMQDHKEEMLLMHRISIGHDNSITSGYESQYNEKYNTLSSMQRTKRSPSLTISRESQAPSSRSSRTSRSSKASMNLGYSTLQPVPRKSTQHPLDDSQAFMKQEEGYNIYGTAFHGKKRLSIHDKVPKSKESRASLYGTLTRDQRMSFQAMQADAAPPDFYGTIRRRLSTDGRGKRHDDIKQYVEFTRTKKKATRKLSKDMSHDAYKVPLSKEDSRLSILEAMPEFYIDLISGRTAKQSLKEKNYENKAMAGAKVLMGQEGSDPNM